MEKGYLYWRKWQRGAFIAALSWATFVPQGPPLSQDGVAARGHQAMPQRQTLRAAHTAYWIPRQPSTLEEAAAPELPEELQRRLEGIVVPPVRAANSVYWWENHLAVEEPSAELPEELQRQLHATPYAPERTASDAYEITGPPVDRVANDVPVEAHTRLEPRPYTAQRTSATSYWLDNRLAVAEPAGPPVPEELRQRLESPVFQVRRGSNESYWVEQYARPPEQPMPEELRRPNWPDRARAPERAPHTFYWIDNHLAVAEPTGEVPEELQRRLDAADLRPWHEKRLPSYIYQIRGSRPATAAAQDLPVELRKTVEPPPFAPRRAANSAYWRENLGQVSDIPPPPPPVPEELQKQLESPVFAPRRGSVEAYWISRQFNPAHQFGGYIFFNASQPVHNRVKRAPLAAYWWENKGDVAEPLPPLPLELQRTLESPRFAPPRAAERAYWFENWLATPEVPPTELPEELRKTLDSPRVEPRRPASSIYWLDNRRAVEEPPTPEAEEVHRRILLSPVFKPQRATADSYSIPIYFLVKESESELTRASIPDRADAPARASASAYWMHVQMATPEPIPLPIEVASILYPDHAPGPQRAGMQAYWIPRTTDVEAVAGLNEIALDVYFTQDRLETVEFGDDVGREALF